MNKFIKRLNKKHLLVLIALGLFSYFFIIGIPPQRLSLTQVRPTQMFNSYFLYDSFNNIPQSGYENYRFILSKILGISLNIDWYDLCLMNDTTPPTKIGKIILPMERNVTLSEIDTWKNRISAQPVPENSINQISYKLIADPTKIPNCMRISPADSGFLYSGLIYFEENNPVSMNVGQEMKIIQMIDGRSFDLGNSSFELKINKDALLIKRLIIFFALSGLYLLILNLWSLIYKSPRK